MSNTTFLPHLLPSLPSGDYTVTVEQELRDTRPGSEGFHEQYARDYELFVGGPRFCLPEGELVSCFPPDGREGNYAHALAYVVLRSPTLPWQRRPGKDDPGAPTPWLAVLVFDEDEDPPRRQVGLDALRERGVFHPPFAAERGEDTRTEQCHVIDVDRGLFRAVAPSREALPWLAHVRSVSTVERAVHAGAELPRVGSRAFARRAPGTEQVAVVLAHRLPRADVDRSVGNVAHLVSLAGFGPYLGPDGEPIPAPIVRVVSLASFRFLVQPRTEYTLEAALKGLHTGALRAPPDRRIPADSPADAALSLGYVPIDHSTRRGEHTVSWYRGPFTPAPVPVCRVAASADAALRYDPEQTGMFDVSYAAAVELGRMLVLQARSAAEAVVGWRRRLIEATRQRIVLLRTSAHLGLGRDAEGLAEALAAGLAAGLEAALLGRATEPRPEAASMPELSLRGALTSEEFIRGLHAGAAQSAALAGDDATAVAEWMGRLNILHGVPFHYLVAHASLLPENSLRRFHVDRNWIDHLIAGAMSVGRHGAIEVAHDRVFAESLLTAARAAAWTERGRLLGLPADPGEMPADDAVVTGFLLRSSLLADWPGLDVAALDSHGRELRRLRLETLSRTTMLGLFDGELATLRFREPTEECRMGFKDGPKPVLALRALNGARRRDELAVPLGDDRVVDVVALARAIAAAVKPAPGQMTSALLGLQLILGASEVNLPWTAEARAP